VAVVELAREHFEEGAEGGQAGAYYAA
jgi:hypothetical protein